MVKLPRLEPDTATRKKEALRLVKGGRALSSRSCNGPCDSQISPFCSWQMPVVVGWPLLAAMWPSSHSSSSVGQGRENITKSSWAEIRTGRARSPSLLQVKQTQCGKINLLPIKIRVGEWEIKPNLNPPSLHPSLLPGLSFTPGFLCLLSDSSAGGQGMELWKQV